MLTLLEIFKTKPDTSVSHTDETNSFLAALQKELNKTKDGALALADLPQMSNMEIYKKYQYRRWDEITELECRYLKKRYKLTSGSGILGYRPLLDFYIGQTFERYDLHNQAEVKKSLYDFSQSQLSEMLEAMVEVLNKKKEAECQYAAV